MRLLRSVVSGRPNDAAHSNTSAPTSEIASQLRTTLRSDDASPLPAAAPPFAALPARLLLLPSSLLRDHRITRPAHRMSAPAAPITAYCAGPESAAGVSVTAMLASPLPVDDRRGVSLDANWL